MVKLTAESDLSKFEEFRLRAFIPEKEIAVYQMPTPFEVGQPDGAPSQYGKPGDYLVVNLPHVFGASAAFVEENYRVDRRSEDQKLQDYINDPKTKQIATRLALQIAELMSDNWFTFERLLKKTGEDADSIRAKLATLELLNLAVREYRGPENALELKYKIILLPSQKAEVLRRDVARMDEHRAAVMAEIEKLEAEDSTVAAETKPVVKESEAAICARMDANDMLSE